MNDQDARSVIADLRSVVQDAITRVLKPRQIVDDLELLRVRPGLSRDQVDELVVAELMAQSVAAKLNREAATILESDLESLRSPPATGTPYL